MFPLIHDKDSQSENLKKGQKREEKICKKGKEKGKQSNKLEERKGKEKGKKTWKSVKRVKDKRLTLNIAAMFVAHSDKKILVFILTTSTSFCTHVVCLNQCPLFIVRQQA